MHFSSFEHYLNASIIDGQSLADHSKLTSTNPFMVSGTRKLVILQQYAARLLKSHSAPVGISNPAFTMNEYYLIHLTPPGQGPPHTLIESEQLFGEPCLMITRLCLRQNSSHQTLQEIFQ